MFIKLNDESVLNVYYIISIDLDTSVDADESTYIVETTKHSYTIGQDTYDNLMALLLA